MVTRLLFVGVEDEQHDALELGGTDQASFVDQPDDRRRVGRRDLSNPHLIKMVRNPSAVDYIRGVDEDIEPALRGSLRAVILLVALFWAGVGYLIFR